MAQPSTYSRQEKHGLFLLHPQYYDPSSCTIDLVAIHGLGGDAYKTWTDDGHLWLKDSLPIRVPQARILTFGYDSSVFFSNSRMSINDYAIDLLSRLHHLRQDGRETMRPLIFICHSLGGVVFKELLIQGSLDSHKFAHMVKCISGVVFMGTPHRGSRVVSPASILSKIINLATLGTGIRSDLLQLLQPSSAELETISRHATFLLKELSIISFYEQKPLGASLIVEPFSAILGLPNERAIPLNADHKKIARLSPRDEQSYLPVWNAIKELVESALLKSYSDDLELLNKLFCFDYKAAQLRTRQPYPGTCDWIFENQIFNSWLNLSQSAALVYSGPSGTGKSVLARYLAETIISGSVHQDAVNGHPVITFFCSYFEEAHNSEEVVLRSILHQTIQLNPYSANIVRNRLENPKRAGGELTIKLELELLWQTLREVLSMDTMENSFIVVDAIDELGADVAANLLSRFLDLIAVINSERPDHRLRLFISSRHVPIMTSSSPILHSWRMARSVMYRNVEAYLRRSIEDFATQNVAFRTITDSSTRRSIAEYVAKRADGMFLWAKIAWEDFRKGLLWNRNVLNEKLEQIDASPAGINALYDKVMDEIDISTRIDAWDIFGLLSVAARPLDETELGILLGIYRLDGMIVSSTDFEPFQNLSDILEQQFPDVVTVHDDNIITFAHLSFKEYLEKTWEREDPDRLRRTRRGITRACLKYLMLQDLLEDASVGKTREGVQSPSDHFQEMLIMVVLIWNSAELIEKYRFLPYASEFFLHHLLTIPYDDSLWLLFADTASSSSIYTIKSLQPKGYSVQTPLRTILDEIPHPEKETMVRNFKQRGYDLDEMWLPREYRGFALQYCTKRNMESMALLLLNLGANPNLPEEPITSNFRSTIQEGTWSLYEALLRHPWIDLNSQDYFGQTVLHNLVQFSTLTKLSEFVENHRFNVNIQDSTGFTPIHLATSLGKHDVVRKLLTVPGIRLDLVDNSGRTPFTLATYWGFQRIALALIENSQAFPIPERDQLSGLIFAAKHGHQDLCYKLLETCQYKSLHLHIDHSGKGILHHGAINNWSYLLHQCLTLGSLNIYINQIDHSGKSALHYAAELGNFDSCQVLLQHGASTRLQDRIGRTAPQAAADSGFKDCLMLLIRVGSVEPNQRDIEGRNLVHWAATLDCVDVLQLLAAIPGVELARKDKHGKMPVDIAFTCHCANVGKFLAEEMQLRGVSSSYSDIYDWDNMYNSPFVMEVDEGEISVISEFSVEDILRRRQQRLDLAHQERERVREKYPEGSWALVIAPRTDD